MTHLLLGAGRGAGGGGGGGGAEATAFLARTSGLDATHTNAYIALIDGLVADGVWSKFDVLRIYATQDSTTAGLNLISSSFTATVHGSPTFTADRGYTGVDASSTVYIDSGFTPAVNGQSGGGHFGQDTAHISVWNITSATSGASGGVVIGSDTGSTRQTNILPKYNDGKAYFRINSNTADSGQNVTNSDSTGHYISNRSASNATQGYRNGSSILSNSNTSASASSTKIFDLAECNDLGNPTFGGGFQIAATSIGSSLSGTDATNFYNRLRTYMTAVGVP